MTILICLNDKNIYKKKYSLEQAWGDGTVWKVLASQAWEPELDAHH